MCSCARLWALPLAIGVGIQACGGGGAAPPSAELFADPEICDVPCEVVLDSGLDDARAEGLTFTWDFGDGPVDGAVRAFHIFETAGTHSVSVTVSEGGASTTDTVILLAEPRPKTSGDIGEAGGTISQGACIVTVPAGIAGEPFTVEVTELPSMELASERKFEPERFAALGSAFDVSMLVKSGTAIDIAVRNPDAAGAEPSELAWLVRTVSRPHPEADDIETPVSPALHANYVLLPVTQVDADGTAHGHIYGRRRAQLVKMAQPLEVEWESPEAGVVDKAVSSPLIVTSFAHSPTPLSRQTYQDAIREGIHKAHDLFVLTQGMRGPEQIVVSVTKLGAHKAGSVDVQDHDLIDLSHAIPTADQVKKAVAHEYFHLVQNIHRNRASGLFYFKEDGWFAEGTASWAMDEVFDELPSLDDYYYAPTVERFWVSLLKRTDKASPTDIYQTVGFWKWAEAKSPGIIQRVLEDQFTLTHETAPGPQGPVENLIWVDFLSSFKTVWNSADFLDFTYNARYLKDFDQEETKARELWSSIEGSVRLEAPKKVVPEADFTLAHRTDTSPESKGDSESNPAVVEFTLLEQLTAYVTTFRSFDLTGTLHVRFPVTTVPLDARVLLVDAQTKDAIDAFTVRDLSKSHEDVKLPFDPSKEAVVFVVDPRWSYPSSTTAVAGEMKAWVEDPCGSLPSNVIDIGPSDDLYVALTTAPAGSAVRLAPGTYAPPVKDFPAPEYGPISANVLVKDLMLIGAGEGQTVMVMNGDPYVGFGFKTYGNATIRNLTIDPRDSEPAFDCWDAKHVTLCNVTIRASSTTDYGILWAPWGGGSTSLGFFDSTLTSPAPENDPFGMFIQSCYVPPADVTVEIRNSEISGWGEGVSFDNGLCGGVSVNTDCEGFSNNLYYNVVDWNCSEGTCNPTELCP
jgi:PKD repeat protein